MIKLIVSGTVWPCLNWYPPQTATVVDKYLIKTLLIFVFWHFIFAFHTRRGMLFVTLSIKSYFWEKLCCSYFVWSNKIRIRLRVSQIFSDGLKENLHRFVLSKTDKGFNWFYKRSYVYHLRREILIISKYFFTQVQV